VCFHREEKRRSPAKGKLEEPSPDIAKMLGDFLRHHLSNPVLNPSMPCWHYGNQSYTGMLPKDAAKVEKKRVKLYRYRLG